MSSLEDDSHGREIEQILRKSAISPKFAENLEKWQIFLEFENSSARGGRRGRNQIGDFCENLSVGEFAKKIENLQNLLKLENSDS